MSRKSYIGATVKWTCVLSLWVGASCAPGSEVRAQTAEPEPVQAISGVFFEMRPSGPLVVVQGRYLLGAPGGTIEPSGSPPHGHTGQNFGKRLHFTNGPAGHANAFSAGYKAETEGRDDWVGLADVSQSNDRIVFSFGSFFRENNYLLKEGDHFLVTVNSATFSGTVSYGCKPPAGSTLFLPQWPIDHPAYHCYKYVRPICDASQQWCTPSRIGQALRIYPAIRQQCSSMVEDNAIEKLAGADQAWGVWQTLAELAGLPTAENYVQFSVRADSLEVVNRTVSGKHALDPGWVDRMVFLQGNTYYVATTGSGIGRYREVNLAMGAEFFARLDTNIRTLVEKGVANDPLHRCIWT